MTKKYALLSVTDKAGVCDFGKGLVELGFSLLSTGGTAKVLKDADLPVTEVAEFAGSPEIFNGRVKTLHPKVHGGILFDRENEAHVKQAQEFEIGAIDLVVVNLYQFEKNALKEELTLAKAIEFIDIGGPTMLRAAAKNYRFSAPVIDPKDYPQILTELKESGSLSDKTRVMLAQKTFRTISSYDSMIASYFEKNLEDNRLASTMGLCLEKKQSLRYGENPHQAAGFYTSAGFESGFQDAKVLQGKELSYNNLMDVDAAAAIVADFHDKTAVAVIKHTNPCGAAVSSTDSLATVFKTALEGDPKSAFGGIVALNKEVDLETAEEMSKIFLECIVAPKFSEEAKALFSKKKNLRLLEVPFLSDLDKKQNMLRIRSVRGGLLVQEDDSLVTIKGEWNVPTDRSPSDQEAEDLAFAMTICKHVKSNAIVYVKNGKTIAVGAGQMSRIDAATFAAEKARDEGKDLEGSILASDAFFPFRDTVDLAAKFGVKAIVQPGGSKRDSESIEACNENGIAMVFTGRRHFKH